MWSGPYLQRDLSPPTLTLNHYLPETLLYRPLHPVVYRLCALQCFNPSGSHLGAILFPTGHVAMSGDICVVTDEVEGYQHLLARSQGWWETSFNDRTAPCQIITFPQMSGAPRWQKPSLAAVSYSQIVPWLLLLLIPASVKCSSNHPTKHGPNPPPSLKGHRRILLIIKFILSPFISRSLCLWQESPCSPGSLMHTLRLNSVGHTANIR